MFVELIDRLRCLESHEDCCLVASATRTVGRHIIEGTLGCPVCGSEYAIHDGAAWFGRDHVDPLPPDAPLTADGPLRLAAMLGVDGHGGLLVLDVAWSACGAQVLDLSPDSRLVLLSASGMDGPVAVLRGTRDALPIAPGCARGVALGRGRTALVDAAVRALARGGRLVAPSGADVPEAIALLARDDAWWVGERRSDPAVSGPVTPRRAAPRTANR